MPVPRVEVHAAEDEPREGVAAARRARAGLESEQLSICVRDS